MFWTLLILAAVLLAAGAYGARAAWAPFTHRGRRRGVYWARGWWRGQQAQNRDEH